MLAKKGYSFSKSNLDLAKPIWNLVILQDEGK